MNGIPWRDKGGMRISTARSCGQRLRAGLGVPRHKQERRRCRRRTVEPFRETNLLLGTMRRWLAEATRPRPFGESLSRSISAQPSHFLCRFCSRPRGRGVEGGGGEGGEDHGYPLDAVHVRACTCRRHKGRAATSCDGKADLSVSTVSSGALQPTGLTNQSLAPESSSPAHVSLPIRTDGRENKCFFSLP